MPVWSSPSGLAVVLKSNELDLVVYTAYSRLIVL